MNDFLKSLRTAFFAGIILLAPLGVTLLVFSWLVEKVGGRFRNYFFFYLPDSLLDRANLVVFWNLLATVMVILLITLLGYLSRYFVGKFAIGLAERIVRTVPFVNAVYGTVKQIVDTFSAQNRAVFQKVVLVEFPRPGSFAIGFLTNKTKGEIQDRTKAELWNVFVPTTPNPTSGFLVMFKSDEIKELDMSVADGMKVIISGGALVPKWNLQGAEPLSGPEQPSVPGKSETIGPDPTETPGKSG